ncbi:patatin-like phospholipase family protein [Planococcus sp. ISL-109]|uniref:patatin-like phospholipase family protein n=1 Tax=Planococcus sp. ISL-109 TaxID=2819166 RepID=UPI001BE6B084|nr:patatin-like phospholipase family protein [Planococcus sp. ISL-109]MBT2581248.1 patatin-like phospholipase family protein [Planococcus sp. ISL-109]
MKKILSIDGGGIRGILPAMMLCELERRTGKPVAEQFDIFVGTSTGAILALGLLVPDGKQPRYSANDILRLYEREAESMFRKSFLHRAFGLAGRFLHTQYNHREFEHVLKVYFEELKLSDLLKPAVIPSYDIHGRHAHFFKSTCSKLDERPPDSEIRHIIRAATAAPSYFAPAAMPGYPKAAFIDGGVFANDPGMCAYTEALDLYGGETEDFLLVSLGTGEAQREIDVTGLQAWFHYGWARSLLKVMMDGSSDSVDHQLSHALASEGEQQRYYRFQEKLPADDSGIEQLDRVTADNLARLRQLGKKMIDRQSDELDRLCRLL